MDCKYGAANLGEFSYADSNLCSALYRINLSRSTPAGRNFFAALHEAPLYFQ